MKKLIHYKLFLLLTIILSCQSSSPYKKIENPNVPFERPGYTILPPAGADWEYYSDEMKDRYHLNFLKKIHGSDSHSLMVGLIETQNAASFENPQEFKKFMQSTVEMAMYSNKLRSLDKNIELDDKFGLYTLKYYMKAEDRRSVGSGNEAFLILANYGYVFIHPNIPKLIIQVSYSERGRPADIRPDLEQEAEIFFNGIMIRKTPVFNQ